MTYNLHRATYKILYSRQLISAQVYLPDDVEFKYIVEFCKLKYNKTWRNWADDQGNQLKIEDNKTLTILPVKEQDLDMCVDLYYAATVDFVLEQSVYFAIIDNLLFLLGKDIRLRIYKFNEEHFIRLMPLQLDINVLRDIVWILHGFKIKNLKLINKLFGIK